MMGMMRACWQWMKSLGLLGIAVGVTLLVVTVGFAVWLIARLAGKGDRHTPR